MYWKLDNFYFCIKTYWLALNFFQQSFFSRLSLYQTWRHPYCIRDFEIFRFINAAVCTITNVFIMTTKVLLYKRKNKKSNNFISCCLLIGLYYWRFIGCFENDGKREEGTGSRETSLPMWHGRHHTFYHTSESKYFSLFYQEFSTETI